LKPVVVLLLIVALGGAQSSASAQFLDEFNSVTTASDRSAVDGWSFFSGDGDATIRFEQGGPGYASIFVDATGDRRNIWWALVKRKVSEGMDLGQVSQPRYELRIEARVRVSHAPRRVNLHLNTQRTTDFHSHLMEFDIPDTENWHTISLTTRDFDARPGDTVSGQLALMDWGLGKYRVDLDHFKVDVVDVETAGPDKGVQVPYHPPIPDVGAFRQTAGVSADSIIDLANPGVNLNNWYVRSGSAKTRLLTVNGTQLAILRFDLGALAARRVQGAGLLELTTHSVQRTSDRIKDFGRVRVVEILGGDPAWEQGSVTLDSLCRGESLDTVLNTQMIIDWPVTEGDGGKTYFTIPQPVLQRLIDGRTRGLAIRPLGSISAAFYAMEHSDERVRPRLRLNAD
jgi:hypothetical protein